MKKMAKKTVNNELTQCVESAQKSILSEEDVKKMDINFIRGVIPPLITPVDSNEHVAEKDLRAFIEYVLNGGVHGVFVLAALENFMALITKKKREL